MATAFYPRHHIHIEQFPAPPSSPSATCFMAQQQQSQPHRTNTFGSPAFAQNQYQQQAQPVFPRSPFGGSSSAATWGSRSPSGAAQSPLLPGFFAAASSPEQQRQLQLQQQHQHQPAEEESVQEIVTHAVSKRKAENEEEVMGAFDDIDLQTGRFAGCSAAGRFPGTASYEQMGVMRKMKKLRCQQPGDGQSSSGSDEGGSPNPPSSDDDAAASGTSAYRAAMLTGQFKPNSNGSPDASRGLVLSPSRFGTGVFRNAPRGPSGAAAAAAAAASSSTAICTVAPPPFASYGGYRMQPMFKHGRFEREAEASGGGGMMAIVEEPDDEEDLRHKNRATTRSYDPLDLSIRVEEFEEQQAAAANGLPFLSPRSQFILPDQVLRHAVEEARWQAGCHALVPYKAPERFIQEVLGAGSSSPYACDEDMASEHNSESSIEEIYVDSVGGMDAGMADTGMDWSA